MLTTKKSTKKYTTGESRYCQNCGKESEELFQVTQEVQKINQLKYCADCKDAYSANQK